MEGPERGATPSLGGQLCPDGRLMTAIEQGAIGNGYKCATSVFQRGLVLYATGLPTAPKKRSYTLCPPSRPRKLKSDSV